MTNGVTKVTYLQVWQLVLLAGESLHELVYFGALDRLGSGELLQRLLQHGGQQQHQLQKEVIKHSD